MTEIGMVRLVRRSVFLRGYHDLYPKGSGPQRPQFLGAPC